MSPPTTTLFAALALGLAGAAGGCGHQPELHPAAPVAVQPHTLQVAGRTVSVELATTPAQRDLGLMHRTHLDADAGMLFIFKDDQLRTFWMKDTLIPLDIIFLDADGTVQNVAHGEPLVEVPGLYSLRPARLVLEFNAGWCEEHGLKPGDKLAIPPELLALGQD
ncbi:MAG TPA: DUF192 domain-containing protein [Planctomycetota bacterium]|nr:DUF192 domain-containing protein [Planctomycetota bacterium]